MHKAEGIGLREGEVKLLCKNLQSDFICELHNPQVVESTILNISHRIQGSHYLIQPALSLQVCPMESSLYIKVDFNVKDLS